jgi:hypothetical protein
MKVYVVTEGEYSAYHIEQIFSTRKNAELYVQTRPKDDYDHYYIEEYELDQVKFESCNYINVYSAKTYLYLKQGKIINCAFMHTEQYRKEVPDMEIKIFEKNESTIFERCLGYIEAHSIKSRKHAEKLAIEKYQTLTQQLLEDYADVIAKEQELTEWDKILDEYFEKELNNG